MSYSVSFKFREEFYSNYTPPTPPSTPKEPKEPTFMEEFARCPTDDDIIEGAKECALDVKECASEGCTIL